MAVTLTKLYEDFFGKTRIAGVQVAFDTSYPTGGYGATLGLSAQRLGFNVAGNIYGASILGINAAGSGVVMLSWDYTNKKLMAFRVATFTATGTIAATGDLNLATPAFSGTGLTAAGQAITTTDNQTMTLNQCAGMWLMAATVTAAPLLIVSNTAVSAAPAVLTVKGSAATDAGAYKIVQSVTPILSGVAQGQVALAQVTNAVDLSAVTCRMEFRGR